MQNRRLSLLKNCVGAAIAVIGLGTVATIHASAQSLPDYLAYVSAQGHERAVTLGNNQSLFAPEKWRFVGNDRVELDLQLAHESGGSDANGNVSIRVQTHTNEKGDLGLVLVQWPEGSELPPTYQFVYFTKSDQNFVIPIADQAGILAGQGMIKIVLLQIIGNRYTPRLVGQVAFTVSHNSSQAKH